MNISNIKNDINLFKDDTLKALSKIEKKLLEKMKLKNIETELKIADFDLKLSKFQEINKRMFESVVEQQVYLDKLNKLNDFKSKTETKLISLDIKLGNFISDLGNIKSYYDKIFLENLKLPGIIGVSCKFHTISDFIKDSIKTTEQLKLDKDLIKKQIDEIKATNEIFEKKFGISIDNSTSNCKLYIDKKINEIKIFFMNKIEEIINILANTKNEMEENKIKNDEISSSIKDEIKKTKEQVTYLLDQNNKENEIIKNEFKNCQNNGIKKELIEIKQNFNDVMSSIEMQTSNSYKFGKHKININNYNNSSVSNKNIFLKSNNILNEKKAKNNLSEREKIKNTENDKNDSYNKNKELFSNYNNNTNNNIDNDNINILEDKNDINKQNFNKEKILFKEVKEDNINKENNNTIKINMKGKENFKINGKNTLLRNIESSKNMIINNNENKHEFLLTNPINISNTNKNIIINNKEHKIIMPENNEEKNIYSYNKNPHKIIIYENNKEEKIFSYNKNSCKKMFKDNYIGKSITSYKNSFNKKAEISRNKSFSKKPNNILNIKENKFSIERKYHDEKFITNKNFPKESTKKCFSENKDKNYNKKYIIHSIDGENTISNLNRKISENNYLKKNNSFGIKLLKNKMKNINYSKTAYLKSQLPIMGLYKEFYDRKMKEKNKKEKANEFNKTPKKVSPAFGRTAYIKFIKEKDNLNLKNYNGNMNIEINDNINDYMNKSNHFNTINGELMPILTLKNNNKFHKKKNKDDEPANLSV